MKKTILIVSIIFLTSLSSIAQKTLLGFKNAEKQLIIEKEFDAQLSAKRVGQNIKLLSSVPHHVGSVGGKFVADEIVKVFKESGWDTKIVTYQLMFPTPISRVLEMSGATNYKALLKEPGIKEDATSGQADQLPTYNCWSADGDVSAEVISTDLAGMIAEGEKLAALHPQIVVKIPMIKEGIKAIKYFSDKGIRTNCTLVFSAGQALLAAKAGATYVSPFIGRLDDISTDGMALIEEIRLIYDNYGFETQILAASVRHVMHILNCAKVGADVITGPLSAIEGLMKHPLTDSGLATFLADYNKGNS